MRRAERAEELAERHRVTAIAGEEEPDNNKLATKGSSMVILGVKPVGITDLAREISPALAKDTVVVSVAAAVSIAQLEADVSAFLDEVERTVSELRNIYEPQLEAA